MPEEQEPVNTETKNTSQTTGAPTAKANPGAGGRNKKRMIIIGSVVAVVALVAAGVGAVAYYNNPNRVIGDALTNLISANSATFNGSLDVVPKDKTTTATKATYEGQADKSGVKVSAKIKVTEGATTTDVNGDFISTDKSAYLRLTNAKQLAEGLLNDPSLLQLYMPLIEKIDNKWIQLDEDSSTVTGLSASQCQSAWEQTKITDADKRALRDLFNKHQFIKIEKQLPNQSVGGKDSLHYQLTNDEKAGNEFAKAALALPSIKALDAACGLSDSSQTTTNDSDGTTTSVELWVDTWSHKPTKALITTTDKASTTNFVIEGKLDAPVSIQKPSGATKFKDLMGELQQSILSTPLSTESLGSDLMEQ